jgi:hypothetical protein
MPTAISVTRGVVHLRIPSSSPVAWAYPISDGANYFIILNRKDPASEGRLLSRSRQGEVPGFAATRPARGALAFIAYHSRVPHNE